MAILDFLQQYQRDLLAKVGIDDSIELDKKLTDVYEGNIRPNVGNIQVGGAKPPIVSDAEKKQLLLNTARNAQNKVMRTFKYKSSNPRYDEKKRQGAIPPMYEKFPYLTETAAEYLWAIGIEDGQDIDDWVKNTKQRWNIQPTGDTIKDAAAEIHETAQDIFEKVLETRDVHPDEWYDLFNIIELTVYSRIMGVGPPIGRWP